METSLQTYVEELVRQKGKITFAEFMDIALYKEGMGYYQKENPFGQQGSFYTSVNASESFGRTLAKSFVYMIKTLGLENAFCEMGAGSGMLANDILNYLKAEEKEIYSALSYTIIEKSGYLINRQKELIEKEHAGKVVWKTFEELKGFSGVFYSNELVDAFPVHRVIRMNDDLRELYVKETDGKLRFWPDDFSTPKLQEYLDNINLRVVETQIVDINLDLVGWVQALADKLDKAVVVTIDYGFEAPMLYQSYRRDGTVTCYYRHTQNNDFFERIGYQDITAFVDFTSLSLYGSQKGLAPLAFMPQWLYLVQSGILEEISACKTDLQKQSVKALIMPEGGFGTNFQVFIQGKGVSIDPDFRYTKSARDVLDEMGKVFSS
ncbi:class I SAM-dependent methyltransferase [Seleniivibrio woodruffii]|uniref:class I SAM-dependent methyltransferase n=1 Tax=Seleniivibrio woodruffii TaxID=1078050 RepID=UPI00240A89CA|nr:SAM-dependent methyltransferase [Seleniivibrio woodruffii]